MYSVCIYNIYMEIRSYPLFLFRKNLVIWFIRAMHVVLSEIVHGISLSRKEKTTFFPLRYLRFQVVERLLTYAFFALETCRCLPFSVETGL